MTRTGKPRQPDLATLTERAKELSCLYRSIEILTREGTEPEEVFADLLEAIPGGWQFPEDCRALLVIGGHSYRAAGFRETPWAQRAPIRVRGADVGELGVYYTEPHAAAEEGPFLREERQLLNTLAGRIGLFLLERELTGAPAAAPPESAGGQQWRVILDFLRRTEPHLVDWIAHKMLNHLRWKGVAEAEALAEPAGDAAPAEATEENRPLVVAAPQAPIPTERVFAIAREYLSDDELGVYIQGCISQAKAAFLITALEDQGSSLDEVGAALKHFEGLGLTEAELPAAVQIMIRVALLRRFFSDDLDFINVARNLVRLDDFLKLRGRVLHAPNSHGKLGGKSAGLYLAQRAAEAAAGAEPLLRDIKVPRTWYIASDAVLAFVRHNNLEEVYDRKYEDVEQVRQEYPHVIQVFKSATFPPELVTALAATLDEIGDKPIVVRSSSLLEDRTGAVFSGKYKSLFLGNQGGKPERLRALQDAIAEVYASIFGPDPIEYRAERNLLDVHEEMGIMIQEVVGVRVGRYFLPAFSGVAFSHNEFRWSPRIRREDGLIRMVLGLGTRAVDRLTDDYPVLFSPGQPALRVNTTAEETERYSQRMVDLIDLEANRFETVTVRELLRRCGARLPLVRRAISFLDDEHVREAGPLTSDYASSSAVVTFNGLARDTPFLAQMDALLRVLREHFHSAVDVEFASDGANLYLLQCRPQSRAARSAPAVIPRDVPREHVLFEARRFISNGRVPDLTHIVYIDPEAYAALPDGDMREVGRTVGRLNKLLPKRQFILIGPGRWGSRGDIHLGVSVTYSDVNNTAVLAEIARRKANYLPDLSFGTHFFQDLVEAEIRYLPLYPDEPGGYFREEFLLGARNLLPELLPESAELAPVIRVIDVVRETGGRVLRVLLNGDLDEAVGIFAPPTAGGVAAAETPADERAAEGIEPTFLDHTRWRLRMAERIAERLDFERFGVAGVWVFGSTKNATAGPRSDLDLLLHFRGGETQRRELLLWLEAWGTALAGMNYLRTGYDCDNLLDARLVTDDDMLNHGEWAGKIGAVTDAARPLRLTSS